MGRTIFASTYEEQTMNIAYHPKYMGVFTKI